ncbi:MAG: GNAT family N-acetyltransferase [Pseudomonadota bacterium]
MTVLQTQRLTLRVPDARDESAFFAFAETDRASFIGGPMDRAAAATAFTQETAHWAMHGYGRFAIVPSGSDVAVGLIGPQFPMGWPENELTWFLFAEGAGKGYATEAGLAVLAWVYETLKWPSVVAYMERHNTRSIALAKRLGGIEDADAMVPGPGVLTYRLPNPAGQDALATHSIAEGGPL